MLTKTRENTCPGPFTFCHQSSPLNTLDPTWLTSSSSKLWILSCCSHLLWFSWGLWRPRDRCGGFASCSCYAMAVVFAWVKGLWLGFAGNLNLKSMGQSTFKTRGLVVQFVEALMRVEIGSSALFVFDFSDLPGKEWLRYMAIYYNLKRRQELQFESMKAEKILCVRTNIHVFWNCEISLSSRQALDADTMHGWLDQSEGFVRCATRSLRATTVESTRPHDAWSRHSANYEREDCG